MLGAGLGVDSDLRAHLGEGGEDGRVVVRHMDGEDCGSAYQLRAYLGQGGEDRGTWRVEDEEAAEHAVEVDPDSQLHNPISTTIYTMLSRKSDARV
jgi:hypothetical protein